MAYYCEKTYSNLNSIDKGDYEDCTFTNCNLSEVDLASFKFIECEFIDCNLSNARLDDTSFQNVHFKNCKMIGMQFENSKAFDFAIKVVSCNLNHSSFYQRKLNRSYFHDSDLEEVDFTEAEMVNSKITNCNLNRTIFDHTNLEKADFSGSTNYQIDPENNRIKGAKFSLPDVIGLLDKYQLKIE